MRSLTFMVAGGICAFALATGSPARGLSLEEALARAAQSRFETAAIPHEIEAGEGRLLQASVAPAPELEIETQDLFEESSVGMSLVRERGGKRDARIAVARAELERLRAAGELRRLEVGYQVRRAYSAALAATQSLELTEEALALARSFAATVAEKVRAGAASPIEETRAAVRLHGAAAEVERARRDVTLARAELALAVGDPTLRVESLEGRLSEDTAIPPASAPAAPLPDSPDLVVLEREALLRRSALAEERAQGAADLTWRAAVSYMRPDREAAVTVGVSIPLATPGRNRGAVVAAAAAAERADLERAAAKRRLAAELQRAHASLNASAREAAILRDDVLVGAARAFATVQEGYRLGKFPYLDVLDASQVLLAARLQYTAAITALAVARIDVDRLLGTTGVPSPTSIR